MTRIIIDWGNTQPKITPKTFQECIRVRCEGCSEGNNTKYQFISCPLRKELKRYEVIK